MVHCADYAFQTTWSAYLEYEKDVRLVTGEHYRDLIRDYLQLQPEYEYFGKRFRKRLAPFLEPSKEERLPKTEALKRRRAWREEAWRSIRTPPSVHIYRLNTLFDFDDYIDATTTGLQLRDAVVLDAEGEEAPLVWRDKGLVLWLYARIENSKVLLDRSAYEVRFQARFSCLVGKLLLVGDTGSTSSYDYLSTVARSCSYFDLSKCIASDYRIRQASLFNTQSLNTAVRRTIRQGVDLDQAPFQLSEKKFVCHSIKGKASNGAVERYFGLTSGRISDRLPSKEHGSFGLHEFLAWARLLAGILRGNTNGTHEFLSRYATVCPAPAAAVPHALIFDPNPDLTLLEGAALQSNGADDLAVRWRIIRNTTVTEPEETVFEFQENPDDDDWPYSITVEVPDGNGKPAVANVLVQYDAKKEDFRFKKGKTTEVEIEFEDDVFSVAHFLGTRRERFAITLEHDGLVFHNRQFFQLDFEQAEARFLGYFTRNADLKDVAFEKVPSKLKQSAKAQLERWPSKSVFAKALRMLRKECLDWLYCDDPQYEIADFIGVNFRAKRALFVHCKYGRGKELSASAFHDLCSQAAKNLVFLRTSRVPPNVSKWTRAARWEGTRIPKWSKGSGLPERQALWDKVKREVLDNPDASVEVWLVLGSGLSVSKLTSTVKRGAETPAIGPLLHLLDGLVANCAEAGVRLRVFGH